jgi:hypothetical protein
VSTDWNIRCLDCKDTFTFRDANHLTAEMWTLIKHADAIAGLAPLFCEWGSGVGLEFCLSSYGAIDPAWFAQHRGHKLEPISEYGYLDSECRGWVTCSECSHHRNCTLERDHEGPHVGHP